MVCDPAVGRRRPDIAHTEDGRPVADSPTISRSRPQTTHEVSRIDSDRRRYADNVEQRDVDLAPLDVADVRAMQSGKFCEALLGNRTPIGTDQRLTCRTNTTAELDRLAPPLLR